MEKKTLFVFTAAQIQPTKNGLKYTNAIPGFSTWIKNGTNLDETHTVPFIEPRDVSHWIYFAGIKTSEIQS